MMIPNVLEFECGARRSKHEIVVDTWDSSYFMSESLAPVFLCGMVPTAALTICNFHLQALNIKSFGEHGDVLQEINPQA